MRFLPFAQWLALLPVAFVASSCTHWELLNPKGDVGAQEKDLIILSLGLMLLVVVPVIVLTLGFAWHYRESNTRTNYAPSWSHSTSIEVVVWSVPCLIVAFLAALIWQTTHVLDPYRPLDSESPPIRVEVIALNWKWLFIYPDLGVATVNILPIPIDTPISFRLTSESMMNSFFIPQLGSQVYAMAGMQTQLHLIASEAGSYVGRSSAYSGEGFSDMHFKAVAMPKYGFERWLKEAREAPEQLDRATLQRLEEPSIKVQATTYGSVAPGLFDGIFDHYMGGRMPATALIDSAPICSVQELASRSTD